MKAVMVQGLTYRYRPQGALVLRDISFEVSRGEMLAVTGLSGCGKSTLCFCLSGIAAHNREGVMQGQVMVNGKNVHELRPARLALEVGMVFQDPDTQIFSSTVEDEIAFGPENLCLPVERIRERVDYVMDILGIAAFREANPYELSGGEKHLVALASVLALDPPVLILDEVMSQLDERGAGRVADVLARLRETGKTIIAVEHKLETVAMADRMMVLEDGALVRLGPTDMLLADSDYMEAKGLLDSFPTHGSGEGNRWHF